MSDKIGKSVLKKPSKPKVKERNVYVPYYSEEFRDIVRYIQTKLNKKVYLIGIRALFERGVPLFRFTDDFDIHTPITRDERDRIINFVRKKYERSKEIWSKFGFALDFYPVGHIDVNVIPPTVYDESWERDRIKINDVTVFLPPIEDVIVMKLLSPRRKDRKDVGITLTLGRDHIDFDRLKVKVKKAGVEKKLVRTAKRYGIEL